MLRLFVLVGTIILVVVTVQWLRKQTPKVRWQVSAALLIIGLLVLVATGRAHWLAIVFAALVPFFRAAMTVLNHFPLIKRLIDALGLRPAAANNESDNTSTVESQYFRMSLNHQSGEMTGEVLKGQFAGNTLKDMNLQQLMTLLQECHDDQESTDLLEAYLDREYEDQWREFESASQENTGSGEMSEDEALDILGLSKGASEREIVDAHRRLIQNIHPDRGGSAYLASKINKAKTTLLGR